jgi:predicted transcriptional regulator
VDPTLVETATPGAIPEAGLDRVGRLERQVDELKQEIEQIKQQFALLNVRDEL